MIDDDLMNDSPSTDSVSEEEAEGAEDEAISFDDVYGDDDDRFEDGE